MNNKNNSTDVEVTLDAALFSGKKTPVELFCEAFDKKCCPRCKCCEMDWENCEQCGGAGESEPGELYSEDPLYYDMEDTRPCDYCKGKGGDWHCSCDDNGKHSTQVVAQQPCSACTDNLEGDGPTNAERATSHRALMKLHRGNRFRLMFGKPMLPDELGAASCPALTAALALVDFGACEKAARPQDWVNVASPMCAFCEEGEDVNLAASRIIAKEYRNTLKIIKDPVAVHINMLRGTIAWTPEHLRHIIGIPSPNTSPSNGEGGSHE